MWAANLWNVTFWITGFWIGMTGTPDGSGGPALGRRVPNERHARLFDENLYI